MLVGRTVFAEEEFSFVVPEEDLPEEQAVRGNKTHKRLKKRRKNKTLWYL